MHTRALALSRLLLATPPTPNDDDDDDDVVEYQFPLQRLFAALGFINCPN